MSRIVNCVKLKREAEGLDFPPYPGELGTRIWQQISKEAWEEWKQIQTRLVNENRLNLADARAQVPAAADGTFPVRGRHRRGAGLCPALGLSASRVRLIATGRQAGFH